MAVDHAEDAPQAYLQVGGTGRRSGNEHGRAGDGVVAPVEDVLRWDGDGWVEGGGPRVCRKQRGRGRYPENPEDPADGWREIRQDAAIQRRCSAAYGVDAIHSCGKASEKQGKRPKPPRCCVPRVNFQEKGCAELRDAGIKLSVVRKDFSHASVSYFNLADQARHPRIFSRENQRPKPRIRAAITAWKMYVSATTLKKVPVSQPVIPQLT